MEDKSTPVLKAKRCPVCAQRFTNDAAFCPFDGEPLHEVSGAWDPAADSRVGTLVDNRYRIEQVLGEGGMGMVYLVRHCALGRPFAMKVLRKDLAREAELCERFIREARSAATISHPNVVQITDYGAMPDQVPYFVMEYLEGHPLSKLIKVGGPLPAGRAIRILVQIAAGLGAAHRAGIVHRDLKPENIFVLAQAEDPERIKILDFGVAKVAGAARMTRTGMVFGSPHYMSPEQAAGQSVDHRADIYSMGVVMYELFTGRVPFEADTYMGVLTKHMFMTPEPFAPAIASTAALGALEEITLRCLEKKPEHRYPTMEALVAHIEEVVRLGAGDHVEVRRGRLGSGPRRTGPDFRLADELEPPSLYELIVAKTSRKSGDRRHQWAVAALAAALTLCAVALGALVWTRVRPVSQPVPPASVTASAIAGLSASEPVPSLPVIAPSTERSAEPVVPSTADASVESLSDPSPKSVPKPPVRPPPPKVTASASAAPPPTSTIPGDIVNPWDN